MNKREIGSRYEEAAAAFLQKQGFRILEKNFRCRQGEIDLVCREGKELVFTEVKYRSDVSCGSPFEAVDFRKQEKIRRTALFYPVSYTHLWEQRKNWYLWNMICSVRSVILLQPR